MLSKIDVAQANRVLEGFYERFQHKPLPAFGNGMLRGDGSDDGSIVAAAVIKHRFVSKFQRPDPAVRSRLTRECYDQWISFEDSLREKSFEDIPLSDRGILYRASALLHTWFDSVDWRNLSNVDIEFTPGETFVSRKGRVSIYQKLRNKSQWCVTHDAAEDFIRLCYNHTSLKRCAKKHMAQISRQHHRWYATMHMHEAHIGYAVFRDRMLNEVLTIVHGSRASTVDKSNEKRRFINVEPLCNVILQRCLAAKIRLVLQSVGNDLDIGQSVHAKRIMDALVSTIDFSNASDSVLLWVCEKLLPKRMFKALNLYRSPFVLIDGCYHMPVKLSSMGNGFTFEVMSALLLAVARCLDDKATVYGDDVIISNASANDFIKAAQSIGFNVNQKKTYVGLPFRESCGAFYMDGYGYITCFDIHWCESELDVVTTVNKLYYMRKHKSAVQGLLIEAYDALLACIPPRCVGPAPSSYAGVSLGYAICDGYRRQHMRSAEVVDQWKRVNADGSLQSFCEEHHYNIRDLSLVTVLKNKTKHITIDKPREVSDPFLLAFYMYSGRVSTDGIRGSFGVDETLVVVTPNGGIIPVRAVKERFIQNLATPFCLLYTACFVAKSRGPRGPRVVP